MALINASAKRGSESIKYDTSKQKSAYQPGEQYFLDEYEINQDGLKENVRLLLALKNTSTIHNKYKIKLSHCFIKNKTVVYEIGETEELYPQNDEIKFNKTFNIPYFFEDHQVVIFYFVKNGKTAENHLSFSMAQIVQSSVDNLYSINIDQYDNSKLQIIVEKGFSTIVTSYLSLSFEMKNPLKDYPIFFYVENKPTKEETMWRMVYKSNIYALNNKKNGENKTVETDTIMICKNALVYPNNPELRVVVCQSETLAIIGYAFIDTTIKNNKDTFDRINIRADYKKSDLIVGAIRKKYYEKDQCSFSDLINQGLKMDLIIGIDYTISNINQTDPQSLHYLDELNLGKLNDYEKAITLCGNILSQYDKDQLYPVYGFGAIIKNKEKEGVNHCFPITFNDAEPEIKLIDNIFCKYRYSFDKIIMSGPTCFAPIIKKTEQQMNEDIKDEPNAMRYYILMILTDGLINDMEEVRDLVVKASAWPLSIIIIGIGDGNFGNMNELESNINVLQDSNGQCLKRKLVTFVKFNEFKGKDNDLIKGVLQQIPQQVVKYYQLINKNSFN